MLVRTRAWAKTLANGVRSHGRAAVHDEEEADGWDLPVSVSQREEEGGSDERDPPVSGRVRRAAPARDAGGSRADLGRDQAGRPRNTVCFPFSFCLKMLDV